MLDVSELNNKSESGSASFYWQRMKLFAGEAKDLSDPRREKEREAEREIQRRRASRFGRLRAEKRRGGG